MPRDEWTHKLRRSERAAIKFEISIPDRTTRSLETAREETNGSNGGLIKMRVSTMGDDGGVAAFGGFNERLSEALGRAENALKSEPH